MKFNKTITAASLLALALISGQAMAEGITASDVGTLPSQRIPSSVNAGDRNPFQTHIAQVEDTPGSFDGDSEESRIRKVFSGLKVTGRVPASDGGSPRVLVGDLILKEGAIVPQVIENQTDILKVTRITDKEVELTWVAEEVADQPRKLPIAINLEPEVSFILPGRGNNGGGQFVTMGKPSDEPSAADVAKAFEIIEGISKKSGQSGDPLVNEAAEERIDEELESSEATQEKRMRF